MPDDVIHRVMRSRVMTSTLVLTHPESASALIYDLPSQHTDAVSAHGTGVKRTSRILGETEVRTFVVDLLGALEPAGAPSLPTQSPMLWGESADWTDDDEATVPESS